MAKARVDHHIPPELRAEMKVVAKAKGYSYSGFLHRVVRAGFDVLRNAPSALDAPITVARPAPVGGLGYTPDPAYEGPETVTPETLEQVPKLTKDFGIETMPRGTNMWFSVEDVCVTLGITTETLYNEIDPEDDTLPYQGTVWIDRYGVEAAVSLCPDKHLGDKVLTWASQP